MKPMSKPDLIKLIEVYNVPKYRDEDFEKLRTIIITSCKFHDIQIPVWAKD
jgi:hypothetical protein